MSNYNSSLSHRIIEIKPIFSQETPDLEDAVENRVQELHDEAEKRFNEAESSLKEAKVKAAHLLEETKKQIQQEKDQWAMEREEIVKQAKEEGYTEGLENGQAQGYQEYTQKIAEANHTIDLARKEHYSIIESSEEDILELALKCAEKILVEELKSSPDKYLSVVRKAVKEVQDQPEITVYVHPTQYAGVQGQREELQAITTSQTKLSIRANEEMELYSCVIESPFGRIDAGIDSQLSELRKKLFEVAHEEIGNE